MNHDLPRSTKPLPTERPKKTKKDKAEAALKKELKSNSTDELKQVSKVVSGKSSVVTEDVLDKAPAQVKEYVEERGFVFKPNPGPQTEFLASPELEVLYGGAAGGFNKSFYRHPFTAM